MIECACKLVAIETHVCMKGRNGLNLQEATGRVQVMSPLKQVETSPETVPRPAAEGRSQSVLRRPRLLSPYTDKCSSGHMVLRLYGY